MPSLCITTYVYGKYIEYIPSFIYSVQAAYPDAYVKIFTPDRLTNTLHSLLSALRQETFQVREGYRISKTSIGRNTHAGCFPKTSSRTSTICTSAISTSLSCKRLHCWTCIRNIAIGSANPIAT